MSGRKTDMKKKLWIPALILELGAVCFPVLSMMTVFHDGEPKQEKAL